MKLPTTQNIVYASDVEEFFYEDTHVALCEGDPVGLDIEYGDEVKLILFENIYWNPKYE